MGGSVGKVPAHGKTIHYDMRRVVGTQREILARVGSCSEQTGRGTGDEDQSNWFYWKEPGRHAKEVGQPVGLPTVILGDFNADPGRSRPSLESQQLRMRSWWPEPENADPAKVCQ